MMFQILLHHFFRYISTAPRPISHTPEVPSPVPFLKVRVFPLQLPRALPFHMFDQLTDCQRRRVFHMHVDMIRAHHTLQNSDILCITNLNQQLSTSWLYLAYQNVIPIFRGPHEMHGEPADRMASNPVAFHSSNLAVPSRREISERLALKCMA